MKYNFVTVNFNTPELVDALIKSIYKNSGIREEDINIIVFDNSTELPFISDKVTVLDNTKGQIIDFDKGLEKFPDKIYVINNGGSDKHCYTIQGLIDNIEDDFLLLDADTLIIKPVRELFNKKVACVSWAVKAKDAIHKRILPYCCYLNCKYLRKHNIKYWDDNYNFALTPDYHWDTGAAFLKHLKEKRVPFQDIDTRQYILHFKNAFRKDLNSQLEGLDKNRACYIIDPQGKKNHDSKGKFNTLGR